MRSVRSLGVLDDADGRLRLDFDEQLGQAIATLVKALEPDIDQAVHRPPLARIPVEATDVDADFAATARAARDPEKRVRFSQPCVEGRCAYWTGSGRGVIEAVLGSPEGRAAAGASWPLPGAASARAVAGSPNSGPASAPVWPIVVTEPWRDAAGAAPRP